MSKESSWITTVGKYAAVLSLVEIGIGSLCHAFLIPLSGQILSLNQGFFLSRAVHEHAHSPHARFLPLWISNIVALLKSLSPAGHRLIPMVAIGAQGMLFTLGTLFFGTGVFGRIVGMTLLSLWAIAQPILYYVLLFGKPLLETFSYWADRLQAIFGVSPEFWVKAFLILVGVKVGIGWILVGLSSRLSAKQFQRYEKVLLGMATPKPTSLSSPLSSWKSAFLGACRDLFRPVFFLSLIGVGTFFYLSSTSMTDTLIYLMRPLAVGFLLFFGFRVLPIERLLERHAHRPWIGALRAALREIGQKKSREKKLESSKRTALE